jgi:hypothetical protein
MPDRFEILARDLERIRNGECLPPVFGADAHGFEVNPPLSESDVTEFESRNRIRLPDDYRQFVTRIGNGGAGPYYGLFMLEEMDNGSGFGPWGVFVGVLSEPFPHTTGWNDLAGLPAESLVETAIKRYDDQIEAFDRKYWDTRLVNGAFPICHLGCALRHWLIVTGPESGNVWSDCRAEYSGLSPVQSTTKPRLTFFDWYREWLDEALSKASSV